MKIYPYLNLYSNAIHFKGENIKKEEYKDPLLNWPVRGLAYSNELGAALSEIAPKFGMLLWFPAMLYFGADFYDKYKNEKNSYNPDAQRGTKQVIFQILASVIFPTTAVVIGQKIASALGVLGDSALSLQTREEIINFIKKFSVRRHIEDYKDSKDEFKQLFEEALVTKREKLIRSNKIKNPFEWIGDILFKDHHPELIAISRKDKVMQFANENIDKIFDIYTDLLQGKKPVDFSNKMWKNFITLREKYAKDPDYTKTFLRDASEDIIVKFQNNQVRNAKLLKTLGGFIALGLAIKPIDYFVEHVIIKKYIEPNLSYMFDLINKNDNKSYLHSIHKSPL